MPKNLERNGVAARVATNDLKSKFMKVTKMTSEVLESPIKSYSDKKEYRLIKLPNGLKSLLVQHFIDHDAEEDDNKSEDDPMESSETAGSHDEAEVSDGEEGEEEEDDRDDSPKEKMAAVALCISVGSFFDPVEIQGLSHFLEHMIFMGSEKYPKENEYDQFISAHGGMDNAMTECEYTMFYFEIVEEHLAGAIDRFAQQFVSPLMLKDSMDREREAVESEFQNSYSDDNTRIMQLCASLANGPASTFTWGNLKTLKSGDDDKLYSAVHAFRKKHYLANKMYLCVESAATLDEQQKLVEENFSAIASGPEPSPLVVPETPFKPEFYDKIYYVKPVADKTKLFISFVMPSMEKHYRSKPHDYLAYIIQHEGVGSLNSYLKKNLLALRVEAGAEDQGFEGNSMFTLFSIIVTLTDEGYSDIEKVLDAIFSFLLVLKTTSIDDHKKAFMELKQIKETSFKYREEKSATDNVEEFAVNMKYFDAKDIITGPDMLYEFDGALIEDLIDRLNERRFNILILSDKHDNFDNSENWFGTLYSEVDFPKSYIILWEKRQLKPEFFMPPSNEFICTNFEILAQDIDQASIPAHPEKIFEENGCECFYKLDGKFKLPHAFIYVYLMSPKTISSVRDMVSTSLYSMIVKHYMTEKLYPAVCAGLGYQLYSEEKGMVLKLSGYNEKLPLLIDIITKELKNIGQLMEPSVFETYRKQFKKFCYNNLIEAKFLNKDCRLKLIEENHKFVYDRFTVADEISFEDLVKFSKDFHKQLKVQILVQGNIAKSEASAISKCVLANLDREKFDTSNQLESRAYKLEVSPKDYKVLYVNNMLPSDKNSTTTVYVQVGPSSIHQQCLLEFVEKVMEEPLFDKLRTQEQLGYSIGCSHRFNNAIIGLTVTVQSQEDKNQTVDVNSRILKFLKEEMYSIIEKEDFATVQTSLIKLKNMVDLELENEVNRNWAEITSREYIFNRLELEAQKIAKLTKEDVLKFYKHNFLSKESRKLSIQIIGSNKSEPSSNDNQTTNVPVFEILKNPAGDVISDIKEFHNKLELYPVTKTTID